MYNVSKGISSPLCKLCRPKAARNPPKGTAESNRKGAETRRGNPRKKSSKVLAYLWLFSPEKMVTDVSKTKMRKHKLGKFGPLANAWRGGVTEERIAAMSRDDYKSLRRNVFMRDNFKCVLCSSSGNLEMDHILEWRNYPEHRYDLNNCRTLCRPCHKNTDNYGNKAKRAK